LRIIAGLEVFNLDASEAYGRGPYPGGGGFLGNRRLKQVDKRGGKTKKKNCVWSF
jgi:hypothetical protein